MTVYVTIAAMNIPRMLKIILPIITQEQFFCDRLPCLKMVLGYTSRESSINMKVHAIVHIYKLHSLDISIDQQG
jgi:hypothetical protein